MGERRQMALRLDECLWLRVEAARGDVPREVWVRRAVEQALDAPADLAAPQVPWKAAEVSPLTAGPSGRVVASSARPFVPRPKGQA